MYPLFILGDENGVIIQIFICMKSNDSTCYAELVNVMLIYVTGGVTVIILVGGVSINHTA